MATDVTPLDPGDLVQTLEPVPHCPREECGGNLMETEGELKCLLCSRVDRYLRLRDRIGIETND